MTYILRDCVETNCIYRILHFIEVDIRREDIDKTINNIKTHFYEEDFDGWTIEDVLEELSLVYTFIIYNFDGYLEI